MPKPVNQPITVVRGDDFYMYLGVKRNGVRISLTGGTVSGQVRPTEDGTLICSWECSLTDQVADPGGVLCHLDKVDTALFTVNARYDIQIDFANGDRTTIVEGPIELFKDTTHA